MNLFDLIKDKFTDINFNINLFSHFLILFTFLTIFFIIFITKVSSDAINYEVTNLIQKFKPDVQNSIRQSNVDNFIIDYLQNINTVDLYSKPDNAVKNHNNGLFKMLIVSLVLLWGGFILFIIFARYSCHIDINFKDLSLENLLVFGFIGFAEYYFFTRIAAKYVPVAPSFITQKLLDTIKGSIIV